MSNYLTDWKQQQVFELLLEGYSGRETAKIAGVSKDVALTYRKILLKDIEDYKDDPELVKSLTCPCGGPSGHRGWCSWRLQRSQARQAVLKRMHWVQRHPKPPKREKAGVMALMNVPPPRERDS